MNKIIFSKKGQALLNWVEYAAFTLLGLGFLLAVSIGPSPVTYFIVFFCGLMGGRLWYNFRSDKRTKWVILLIFFIIGYTFGSFHGNRGIIISIYIAGIIAGFFLHFKNLIKSL